MGEGWLLRTRKMDSKITFEVSMMSSLKTISANNPGVKRSPMIFCINSEIHKVI